MSYTVRQVGESETLEYRLYFGMSSTQKNLMMEKIDYQLEKDDTLVSPFHDIPLWADKEKGIVNMIVEIPRTKRAKLEISRDIPLNPIKQDVKNGKLRYVAYEYPFNYGALPQTWENPTQKDSEIDAFGDNDPLDVCDISGKERKTGDVIQLKVLGTYAMIDEGEADWKIVGIDVTDPNADKINSHEDIDKVLPGTTKTIFEFLRDYKIPDGKPPNEFAFNGELKGKDFAIKVIEETYEQWRRLIQKEIPNKEGKVNIATECTQLGSFTPYTIDKDTARTLAKL